jgi:hypothetical protein
MEGNQIIIRTLSKPPKEYKEGQDFRIFAEKFHLYCELNQIPMETRAQLLLTLLDGRSFRLANNLGLDDYQELVEALTRKFDSPAGELGNQIKLNNRKQKYSESLSEYLDALCLLAQRTNLEIQGQHQKIIETIMENANDPKVREKILKLLAHAQERHWEDDALWHAFKQKIESLEKIRALKQFTNTPDSGTSEINTLTQKVNELLNKKEPVNSQKQPTSKYDFTPPSKQTYVNSSHNRWQQPYYHKNHTPPTYPNRRDDFVFSYLPNRGRNNPYFQHHYNPNFRHQNFFRTNHHRIQGQSPYMQPYHPTFRARPWFSRNVTTPRYQPKNSGCGAGDIAETTLA